MQLHRFMSQIFLFLGFVTIRPNRLLLQIFVYHLVLVQLKKPTKLADRRSNVSTHHGDWSTPERSAFFCKYVIRQSRIHHLRLYKLNFSTQKRRVLCKELSIFRVLSTHGAIRVPSCNFCPKSDMGNPRARHRPE